MTQSMTKQSALDILSRVRGKVGNTPLVELSSFDVPNECRIFVKEEYKNPTYSHYDRQTVELLSNSLEKDIFIPGESILVETTTGSSGASFAWMCKCIGTKCIVFIPDDMPHARKAQIKKFGAQLVPTPEKEYVGGLIDTVLKWEAGKINLDSIGDKNKTHHFMNHAGDRYIGPQAMSSMFREIKEQLKVFSCNSIDYYITALGNGTSISGIISEIKNDKAKVIGFEPYNSPSVLSKKFPDKFDFLYNGKFPDSYHKIIGTGPGQLDQRRFPNILKIMKYLDHIEVVTDDEMLKTRDLLHYKELLLVGNSSAAAIHTALKIASDKRTKKGSIILAIAYDPAWRYLDG